MSFRLKVMIGDKVVADRPDANYAYAKRILPGLEATFPLLVKRYGKRVSVITEVDGVSTVIGSWSPQSQTQVNQMKREILHGN